MIAQILFAITLVLLVISALTGLAKESANLRDRAAPVHKIVGIFGPFLFLSGVVFLYFEEAHRILIISALHLLLWISLTGPGLGFLAKSPVFKWLHRLFGLATVLAVLMFFVFILRF